MSYTFEEIMNFHPDNKNVYDEIKENIGMLVPFVGAGLTSFVYGTWTSALVKLAEKITDPAKRQQIVGLAGSGGDGCFEAAQMLEDQRTANNFEHDLYYYFSAEHLKGREEQLRNEAVWLLPDLFRNLVVTTNFDHVLEQVYRERGCEFQALLGPGENRLLTNVLRENKGEVLFKVHGTVQGKLLDYGKVVLTKRQYDKHYAPDSALTQDLEKCFATKAFLFLGCSLKEDRTMELLERILCPGYNNYTIINCERSERDEKIQQLGKLQIRAILYEGERHEAVRIILERLIRDLGAGAERQPQEPERPEIEFYRLWQRVKQSLSGSESDAVEALKNLLLFLDKRTDNKMLVELCITLSKPIEGIKDPLPKFLCVPGRGGLPLLYAQACVWMAKTYVKRSGDVNQMRIDSFQIRENLKKAEAIMEDCGINNIGSAREMEETQKYCEKLRSDIDEVKWRLERKNIEVLTFGKVNQNEDASAYFEPVFSGSFDSVAGSSEENLCDLELNFFQLAASGKTILLQAPQIVDNLNMLRLLHTPGFRMLCEMGIVAFSSYGKIMSTNEYLIRSLNDPKFEFSSFAEYNNAEMGKRIRKVVRCGLEGNLKFEEISGNILGEFREKLEFLYDSYRLANECFGKEEILKYHQNGEVRTAKFHLYTPDIPRKSLTLPTMLHEKIIELKKDQRQVPVSGRDDYLRCFAELEKMMRQPDLSGKSCQTRSDYKRRIDKLAASGKYDQEVLGSFWSLVNTCYLFSMGKQSCEKVILPVYDPMLRIYHKNLELQENIYRVDFEYKRYTSMSSEERNVIGWTDLAECVLNVRAVLKDPGVPAEDKARMMEKETDLVYATALDGTPYAKDMDVKTSSAGQVHLSDRDPDSTQSGNAGEDCYQLEHYQNPVPVKE